MYKIKQKKPKTKTTTINYMENENTLLSIYLNCANSVAYTYLLQIIVQLVAVINLQPEEQTGL